MTTDELLNKYHLDKIEIIEEQNLSYIFLHEKNGLIMKLPINFINYFFHLNFNINENIDIINKLEYLIKYFDYDKFVKMNFSIMPNDYYSYRFVIDELRHRCFILNKWKEIIKKTNIDQIYYNDISLLLERKLNKCKLQKQTDGIFDNIITYTLIILSNIDLSKVVFTENKSICEKYTINFSINDYFSYYLKKDIVDSTIVNIVKDELNKIINEKGGIIIYDILTDIYQINDMSFFNNNYFINNYIIGSKKARYAKVLRLKNLILKNDSKNTQL